MHIPPRATIERRVRAIAMIAIAVVSGLVGGWLIVTVATGIIATDGAEPSLPTWCAAAPAAVLGALLAIAVLRAREHRVAAISLAWLCPAAGTVSAVLAVATWMSLEVGPGTDSFDALSALAVTGVFAAVLSIPVAVPFALVLSPAVLAARLCAARASLLSVPSAASIVAAWSLLVSLALVALDPRATGIAWAARATSIVAGVVLVLALAELARRTLWIRRVRRAEVPGLAIVEERAAGELAALDFARGDRTLARVEPPRDAYRAAPTRVPIAAA